MNSIAHESLSATAVPIPPEPAEHIAGKELIAYDIAKDGSRFCMSFACVNGKKGSLSFPTKCLKSLILTLPRMMTQALRARFVDQSLRLVYPAETVRLEGSPDPNTFIMTLMTSDGFDVSFSLSRRQLRALGKATINS
jgi:hypothetical protein